MLNNEPSSALTIEQLANSFTRTGLVSWSMYGQSTYSPETGNSYKTFVAITNNSYPYTMLLCTISTGHFYFYSHGTKNWIQVV